jgi:hypothetical protein
MNVKVLSNAPLAGVKRPWHLGYFLQIPESGFPIWHNADHGSSISMYSGVAREGKKSFLPLTELTPVYTPRHERGKKKKKYSASHIRAWQGFASANDRAVSHPMGRLSYHIALHVCKDRPRVEKTVFRSPTPDKGRAHLVEANFTWSLFCMLHTMYAEYRNKGIRRESR